MSKILLVTGPGGAGKSTACGLFADSVSGTWALIEQDEIRRQVKAGFKILQSIHGPTKCRNSGMYLLKYAQI